MGAGAAYIVLDVSTTRAVDAEVLRAAYVSMGSIASAIILPLALASLFTGVFVCLSTRWGLFRHYWVTLSLALTIVAVVVLVLELSTIQSLAAVALDPTAPGETLQALPSTLVHSIGGVAVLGVILVLNVFKPAGVTRYGRRRQLEERQPMEHTGKDV
jgi:hypothetical protein